MLIGTNLDEGRLFANEVKTMDRYQKETIWMYGDEGQRVLDRYPVGDDGPAYAIAANFTDQRFACPSQALRRVLPAHVPVWGYEFADRQAPFVLPDWIVGLDLGAYHASELAYVFGTSWVFADVKRFTPQQEGVVGSDATPVGGVRHARLRRRMARRRRGAGPVRVFAPEGDQMDQRLLYAPPLRLLGRDAVRRGPLSVGSNRHSSGRACWLVIPGPSGAKNPEPRAAEAAPDAG